MIPVDQLATNRILTQLFIGLDPTPVVLTPRTRVKANGAWKTVDGIPRVPQTFKMIEQGANFSGITESGDGIERVYEFIMLGAYDAIVEIGDYWTDLTGQVWEVGGFLPANGYEIKAGIYSYGSRPVHG